MWVKTFCVFGLLFLQISSAYAFNAVVLYDTDFRKFISQEFPFGVAISMSVWLCLYLRPYIAERCSWARWVAIMVATQFTAIYLCLALMMTVGLLLYKIITQPEQPFVPWVAAVYFGALFIYVVWWLTQLAVRKAYHISKKPLTSEEEWFLRGLRFKILWAVIPLYLISYFYLLRQIG